tara:strand:- start:53 stop:271 length:219 start_codon:yes stop_codon:yes gene_type:complete
MKELTRTNDLILIAQIQSILNDADIKSELLDSHASIMEGSINAIQKRIVVSNNDFIRSRKLIQDLTNDEENE